MVNTYVECIKCKNNVKDILKILKDKGPHKRILRKNFEIR